MTGEVPVVVEHIETGRVYQDGTRISDVNGDQSPTGLDLVSGTCSPAPCTGSESAGSGRCP